MDDIMPALFWCNVYIQASEGESAEKILSFARDFLTGAGLDNAPCPKGMKDHICFNIEFPGGRKETLRVSVMGPRKVLGKLAYPLLITFPEESILTYGTDLEWQSAENHFVGIMKKLFIGVKGFYAWMAHEDRSTDEATINALKGGKVPRYNPYVLLGPELIKKLKKKDLEKVKHQFIGDSLLIENRVYVTEYGYRKCPDSGETEYFIIYFDTDKGRAARPMHVKSFSDVKDYVRKELGEDKAVSTEYSFEKNVVWAQTINMPDFENSDTLNACLAARKPHEIMPPPEGRTYSTNAGNIDKAGQEILSLLKPKLKLKGADKLVFVFRRTSRDYFGKFVFESGQAISSAGSYAQYRVYSDKGKCKLSGITAFRFLEI